MSSFIVLMYIYMPRTVLFLFFTIISGYRLTFVNNDYYLWKCRGLPLILND